MDTATETEKEGIDMEEMDPSIIQDTAREAKAGNEATEATEAIVETGEIVGIVGTENTAEIDDVPVRHMLLEKEEEVHEAVPLLPLRLVATTITAAEISATEKGSESTLEVSERLAAIGGTGTDVMMIDDEGAKIGTAAEETAESVERISTWAEWMRRGNHAAARVPLRSRSLLRT